MNTPASSSSPRQPSVRPRWASLAAAFLLLGSGFFFTGCVADGGYGYASVSPASSYYGGYGYAPSYYGGYGYGGSYYAGGFLLGGRSYRHHYGRHHYIGHHRYGHRGYGFRGGDRDDRRHGHGGHHHGHHDDD